MSVPYEKIVAEDINLGLGTVSVTMPGGGSATGNKVNLGTFGVLGFSASRATTQSIAGGVSTTVQLATEDLDRGAWYNPSTYRFVPQKAGLYLIVGQARFDTITGSVSLGITRNGVGVVSSSQQLSASGTYVQAVTLVSMNGSTDYIEMKAYHTAAAPVDISECVMSGVLLGNLL